MLKINTNRVESVIKSFIKYFCKIAKIFFSTKQRHAEKERERERNNYRKSSVSFHVHLNLKYIFYTMLIIKDYFILFKNFISYLINYMRMGKRLLIP